MAYTAFITRIKNVRPHPNADRLQMGECFGNTVIVSMEYEDNQLGVYFPSDGQVSTEFAETNNLLRKKDENGNNIGGYMDPDKRNVTAIKLRGEKSDGLFLPLTCLETFGDITNLKPGDRIDLFNGTEICTKYIPKTQHRRGGYSEGNRTRKTKAPIAPLFAEHADTEQLAYNLGAFKVGDELEFTLKMHGTSQRTGYLPVLKGYKKTLLDRILRKDGTPIYDIKPYLSFTDSHPDAVGGFADKVFDNGLAVEIPFELENKIDSSDTENLKEILKSDPRPHYQNDDRTYAFEYSKYHIEFMVQNGILKVLSIDIIKDGKNV